MKSLVAALVLALLTILVGGLVAETKYILNAKRLSSTEEALSCNNGADPTGTKVGNTLIISCGK